MPEESKSSVVVDGEYRESDTHIPNPTDVHGRFKTSGTGPSGHIEKVSPLFEQDKFAVAEKVSRALDPDDDTVPRSAVLLPEATLVVESTDLGEDARAVAARRLEQGFSWEGPDRFEAEAAKSGEEGVYAAQRADREQAGTNSVGGSTAGRHDPDPANAEVTRTVGASEGRKRGGGTAESTTADEPKTGERTGDDQSSDQSTSTQSSDSGSGKGKSQGKQS